MKNRVKRVFNMIETEVDAVLIKNAAQPYIDENFFYVTGLEHGIFEGSTAVLYPDGNIDVVVSELEVESAKNAEVHILEYKKKKDAAHILKRLFSPLKKVGVNFERISHKDFHRIKTFLPGGTIVDVSQGFAMARLIKDAEEIARIKRACAIADKIMEQVPDMVHEGMHEFQMSAELDYLIQKHGADKPAFDTISSFGVHTAEPHYTHGEKRLQNGDFILVDMGACYRRYNSDITRTYIFGTATKQQREMYNTVYEAQQRGFDAVKPGVKASEVHMVVDSYIEKTKFKGRFVHSTGHSLGLAVHDGYGFSPDSTIMLEENMVFTVEPGVYLPGIGGVRIEDDILVKKDGIEVLTTADRKLSEIPIT